MSDLGDSRSCRCSRHVSYWTWWWHVTDDRLSTLPRHEPVRVFVMWRWPFCCGGHVQRDCPSVWPRARHYVLRCHTTTELIKTPLCPYM